mmetsp:Transcript_8059/g.19200  ORF Transcript_8059/g.19200 Transcript_8059/m.19200 type:complete len:222 (+) Transcript_8059:205-870(+)
MLRHFELLPVDAQIALCLILPLQRGTPRDPHLLDLSLDLLDDEFLRPGRAQIALVAGQQDRNVKLQHVGMGQELIEMLCNILQLGLVFRVHHVDDAAGLLQQVSALAPHAHVPGEVQDLNGPQLLVRSLRGLEGEAIPQRLQRGHSLRLFTIAEPEEKRGLACTALAQDHRRAAPGPALLQGAARHHLKELQAQVHAQQNHQPCQGQGCAGPQPQRGFQAP